MPVFLFYSVVTTQGTAYAPPRWQGWFGVASTNGSIEVAGATEPADGFAACEVQSTTTCYVVSGLKYLDYASGVDAGFALAPAPIETCDITTAGSCSGQPVLTVGLNAEIESGFSATALICPPTGYVGPADIAGYPVCQKNIPGVNVKTIGLEFAFQFTGDAFFDTGTPYFYFSTPPNEVFLSRVSAERLFRLRLRRASTIAMWMGRHPLEPRSISAVTATPSLACSTSPSIPIF
jgi:hypothetical protein